jgi:heme A synthase
LIGTEAGSTLIIASRPGSRSPVLLALTLITVLFGALTGESGAMASCGGSPFCNGQIIPSAGPLAWVQWTHRLLAYTLAGYLIWWVMREPRRVVAGWVALMQIALAATMIAFGFPRGLQAGHAGVGAAVWAGMVTAAYQQCIARAWRHNQGTHRPD